MRHFIIVGLLIVALSAAGIAGAGGLHLMPVQASEEAVVVDNLFGNHVDAIIILYALVMSFMFYSVVVFRRKKGDEGDGQHFHTNHALELTWTIVPLLIVFYFAYLGGQTLKQILAKEDNELQVNVTGYQWAWSFEYPTLGGLKSPDLYLPQGQQVHFSLQAQDVIHSFWVPEFRLKQDAVPGMTTELRLKPTRIGEYKVRCAELCGLSHAYMEAKVQVLSKADFDAWAAQQQSAALPTAEQGAALYKSSGCFACHSVDGAPGVGPTWKGLFGSEVPLADGTTVTADEGYIAKSIIEPNGEIVQGFNPNIMPAAFGQTLSEAQIQSLVEYIKTLK